MTTDRKRSFFGRVSSHYQQIIRTRGGLPWMRLIVEPLMGEKVLDVGNGGVREFSSPQTTLYVGVDFSLEMLKKGKDKNIHKVCGEAADLAFKTGSFDTIFYRSLLHHLAEKSVDETIQTVKSAIKQGGTCLKRNGNVIIIEPCLPTFLEKGERVLYFLLRIFFFFTKQPLVFLFSADTLVSALRKGGYREVRVWKADDHGRNRWKWISPTIGFPLLKIPRWLNPARSTVLEARKGSSNQG
jgi:hypothetical protein